MAQSVGMIGAVPAIKITSANTEVVKISCPYCHKGGTQVVIEKGGAAKVTIEGIREPQKCSECGRFFKLKPRLILMGVPMEEENGR